MVPHCGTIPQTVDKVYQKYFVQQSENNQLEMVDYFFDLISRQKRKKYKIKNKKV